jgi:tetratricopeptide (TPR) repeat protein
MLRWIIPLLALPAQAQVQVHIDAARKAEAAADFRAAEKEYVEALKEREDGELFQRLGLVRHLQNKYAEAIEALEHAVRINPDAWGAQLFLGIDYYRTNQFGRGLEALRRAARVEPNQPEVQFWIGVTYIALKRYLDGLQILAELSQTQPKHLEALRILAQACSDYSVELHNVLTAEHPESAWAHRVHGQALENDGFCDAAIVEYRKARELKPDMEGILDAIARCEKRN